MSFIKYILLNKKYKGAIKQAVNAYFEYQKKEKTEARK